MISSLQCRSAGFADVARDSFRNPDKQMQKFARKLRGEFAQTARAPFNISEKCGRVHLQQVLGMKKHVLLQ